MLIASGALAAVNGANIRVIVINMTTPEARGAAIAVLNFVNCLGRGIGPSLAEMYMSAAGVGRREAVVFFLNCWLLSVSGLLISHFELMPVAFLSVYYPRILVLLMNHSHLWTKTTTSIVLL